MKTISKENAIKAYKVFNPNFTCRNFVFEIGKEYHEDNVNLCNSGFHSCLKVADCFNYYGFDPKNRVAEILVWGTIQEENDKMCSSDILVVKEISWSDMLTLANIGNGNTGRYNIGDRNAGDWNAGNRNTGDRNAGDWNAGNSNTGYRNTGDRNTGDSNTGYRNAGNWNTGSWNRVDKETGFFNTEKTKKIRAFNKECCIKEWDNCDKPSFLYFDITKWDDTLNKTVSIPYKQAFQDSYNNLSVEEKQVQTEQLKNLPNFDKEVFYQISGIMID